MNMQVLQSGHGFEGLNDQLLPFLKADGTLHHLLVIDRDVTPDRVAAINEFYGWKIQVLDRARQEKDWQTFVYAHERPYRVHAFDSVADRLGDAEYWELLSNIWSDSDNVRQNKMLWRACWSSERAMKHRAMTEMECAAYDQLPEAVRLYRGQDRKRCSGMSWSPDLDKAIWFANRFGADDPWVLTAIAKKANVHAYLDRRNEKEIVATKVRVISREIVKAPARRGGV